MIDRANKRKSGKREKYAESQQVFHSINEVMEECDTKSFLSLGDDEKSKALLKKWIYTFIKYNLIVLKIKDELIVFDLHIKKI